MDSSVAYWLLDLLFVLSQLQVRPLSLFLSLSLTIYEQESKHRWFIDSLCVITGFAIIHWSSEAIFAAIH
uniref:Uncharacterized protein n=1 Tax=Cucumis melo TaxID=3656 RepID=A0A9I9EH93_CUCME